MNKLTRDFIAIDTNIFEHLLNPQNNTNDHVYKLLKQLLIIDKIKLLVDGKKKITDEYDKRLTPRVKQINDDSKKRRLLRYWIKSENRKYVKVSEDELMGKIKIIIPPKKGKPRTDRYFVYVAFKEDRVLITNDRKDMIDEGIKKGERRKKLLKISKKIEGSKNANILTSQIAYDRL